MVVQRDFSFPRARGPRSARARGDRLPRSASSSPRPRRARRRDAGGARPQRRRQDSLAQVAARPPAALGGQARAAPRLPAAHRLRAPARPARHELAALSAGRGADGPHPPARAPAPLQAGGRPRRARGALRDRHRRPGRPPGLRALRGPAPARAHRPRHRRGSRAAGPRRADQRNGSGCRARAARARAAPQDRAQPLGRARHPPAHRRGELRDRRGARRPRAARLRGRARARDDRPSQAPAPLRPRGAGRRRRRTDRRGHRRPDGERGAEVSFAAFADFWSGRDLWVLPLLAGVLAAGLLAYLGVFVVLKRMVFVSAALSEISGVGVAFAFYIGAVAGIDPHAHGTIPLLLEPTWFSLFFACLAAALFSLRPGHRKLATETIVGLGYIISSALVLAILNSPRIVQEAHAVGDILFGNAVTVPLKQIEALF